MPRLFAFWRYLTVIAAVTSAGAPVTVRAQPPNPLRPSGLSTAAVRIVPLPSSPVRTAQSLANDQPRPLVTSDESQELPSVVRDRLVQPELMPAPASAAPDGGDYFNPPDFDDPAPWEPQLVHPLFAEPWFSHGDPNDPQRHIGIGQPLIGTSWRNRPLYFGTFVGGVMLDDIVPNRIYQNDTALVGVRLGYDFDHFWGLEARYAFARPDLADGSGTPFFPAGRDYFTDVSLVYYPFGDTRWRPYLVAGLGFQAFRFNNQAGQRISELTLEAPVGAGIKYFYGPWFTLRFDFVDNLSFGNNRISGMNNLALMAGAEFRFGGNHPSYFPWHGNTTYW